MHNNNSFKNLKMYQDSSPFAVSKLVNNNSSGNLRKAKHIVTIRKDKLISSIPKHTKLSKESQLINCIQNISPFLGKKIEAKDIKSAKYWSENKKLVHINRNQNSESRINNSQLHSISSHIPNVKLIKKYNKASFTDRNNSNVDNLPPIMIDSDNNEDLIYLNPFNIRGFTIEKAHDSSSNLPEFKSPYSGNRQLLSLKNNSKNFKLKKLISQSPNGNRGHQSSIALVNAQNQIKRNDRLKHQSSLSISACENSVNAQNLCSLTPLGGIPVKFSSLKDNNTSLIEKLNKITSLISDENIAGVAIKPKPGIKQAYISKRDTESRMFMPILQEKGKLSYLLNERASGYKDKQLNKATETAINLSGIKVNISVNK